VRVVRAVGADGVGGRGRDPDAFFGHFAGAGEGDEGAVAHYEAQVVGVLVNVILAPLKDE
jgi:hypothetical protein